MTVHLDVPLDYKSGAPGYSLRDIRRNTARFDEAVLSLVPVGQRIRRADIWRQMPIEITERRVRNALQRLRRRKILVISGTGSRRYWQRISG